MGFEPTRAEYNGLAVHRPIRLPRTRSNRYKQVIKSELTFWLLKIFGYDKSLL